MEDGDIIQQVIVEILGSFFFVFMYLSSTEEKTKFTKDAAVQTIILAGSYLAAMLVAGTKLKVLGASPVNPAIAFWIIIFNANSDIWKSFWIFCFMSLVGSMLSLFFFKCVYQKTADALGQMDDEAE